MTTISSKQVTTYMNNGQTRLLRKLGPSIARRNEFSEKLSSLVPFKEHLYLRFMEEVDAVIRVRNHKKWRHFLSLEGWRGDIGEMDKDCQNLIWSNGVLVHSGHIYSAAAVVTNESWNKLVLQSATPVLVEFHGSGCVPCNEVRKVVDELKIDYDGQLKFFVLYADQDGGIAERYEVEAMPMSLVFRNGEARQRVAGTSREVYEVAVETVINEV